MKRNGYLCTRKRVETQKYDKGFRHQGCRNSIFFVSLSNMIFYSSNCLTLKNNNINYGLYVARRLR